MKAIVLTFDKYMIFADHMIHSYMKLWPEKPFVFKIPYQSEDVKKHFETKYGQNVEMIPSPSGIVDTMDALLSEFDDSDWIYWCMDDRYPVSIDSVILQTIYNWVISDAANNISGLMFTNSPWGKDPHNLFYCKHKISTGDNFVLLRRKGYRMIWVHQFLRVKVLRNLFDNFRVTLSAAKDMDYILLGLKLPDDQKLYVSNKNIVVYGESTSRGLITKNCYKSLIDSNFNIPPNFIVGPKTILQGNSSFFEDIRYFILSRIKRILNIGNDI